MTPINEFDEANPAFELEDDPGFGLVSLAVGLTTPYILIYAADPGGEEVQVVARGFVSDDVHAILCEVAERIGETLE